MIIDEWQDRWFGKKLYDYLAAKGNFITVEAFVQSTFHIPKELNPHETKKKFIGHS